MLMHGLGMLLIELQCAYGTHRTLCVVCNVRNKPRPVELKAINVPAQSGLFRLNHSNQPSVDVSCMYPIFLIDLISCYVKITIHNALSA